MRVFGWVMVALLALPLMLGLGFAAQGWDFFMFKFWAPKYANVQREVFQNTMSYNQGMIQELENMQFEYQGADEAHKQALARIILHRTADFPEERMPAYLRGFIDELRRER